LRKSLVALLALTLVPHARCSQDPAAGERRALTVDGIERTFYVHGPLGAPRPLPLVLVFHGGGGTAAGTARLTGMNRVADEHRFLAVYPEGVGKHWNDTRGLSKTDDVRFVDALVEALGRSHEADPGRVFAAGMSNGGFFATRLGCDLPDRIAAIAMVAATMPETLASQCKPGRPVPALFFFGDQDPLVKIGGGMVGLTHGRALSLDDAVSFWCRRDGIVGRPPRESLPLGAKEDGTSVERERAVGGREGSEVTLYLIRGGGHTWPGGQPYLPRLVGTTSRQIDASEVIWDFFASHPMP
jgi:polyhydroxybutyrate depolymerase